MQTLQMLWESKLDALLSDAVIDRFEASGVLLHEDHFVLIFDNVNHVARIDTSLAEGGVSQWVHGTAQASGHEDITYNPRDGRFYVLIEAVQEADGFRSAVVEYDLDFVPQACHLLPFHFADANKGFEGLTLVRRGELDYLLALCEGNRCRGGAEGRERGKGRIQLFTRAGEGWSHAGTLKLPPAANFSDYSSLDIRDDRVAVLSQESSQVWLGRLDPTSLSFVDEGRVVQLPRDARGRPRYCNAEGVAWISSDFLVIVSDKRKRDAPERCTDKDQSIHIVRLS